MKLVEFTKRYLSNGKYIDRGAIKAITDNSYKKLKLKGIVKLADNKKIKPGPSPKKRRKKNDNKQDVS